MPENVIVDCVTPKPEVCRILERQSLAHRFLLRVLDLLFSSAGLLLSLPLFLIIPVFIKLDSPGRVFFVQRRLGQGGKDIQIIKFRTMLEGEANGRWTVKDDPRITRVGQVLRKLHLDELPQLLNVMNGDLSLVGPRPYTREVFEQLCRVIPDFSFRLCFKPGLTGWAQLVGRKGDGLEHHIEMLNNDRRYLDQPLTLGIYLKIVFLTFGYFLSGGAINRIIR
ncbi:MAG: sugar transferase [Deltaproteobacteria bacterium]|nr:MAG: sugar transferase [Deltaproteobacteria bacterium]